MKKLSFIPVFLYTIQLCYGAEELKYPVAQIPDSLKTNAKAVIRTAEQEFEFSSVGKGTERVTYALTVLNENGLDLATFNVPYSQKLMRVHTIRGAIYDATGKKVENLTQDKVIDQSMISGYSLYEDSRVKYFTPKTLTYPFTVEYSYVTEYDGFLKLPDWAPVIDYNISIEQSKYRIICPSGLSFHYKERQVPEKCLVKTTGTGSVFEWGVKNVVASIEEPFSGPPETRFPHVIAAPDEFVLEGFPGNSTSWKTLGDWINTINAGRDALPVETINELKKKVSNCSTDFEKTKAVYEYMQEKTRYLNVSIGIGGFQAQPAETVDRLGYGDCKALSNYTKALLDAVGIKAYYTRIRAGKNEDDVDPSFPVNFSNHIILCVPLSADTIWLECTNQHFPFGYIGTFTDDRKALLVSDEGGKLVHTRKYKPSENVINRNTIIQLGQSGDAEMKSNAKYIGLMYEDCMGTYLAGSEDRKRIIYNNINLPGTELFDFNYSEVKGEIPVLQESLRFGVMRYATISGPRMIVSVVPLDRQRDVPKKVNNRKSDVVIKRSSIAVDSVTVLIPEGFTPEAIPSEIKSESRFGKYSLKVMATADNKIVCIRKLELFKGTHAPSTYNELVDFYKKIAVSDNSKISLKRT